MTLSNLKNYRIYINYLKRKIFPLFWTATILTFFAMYSMTKDDEKYALFWSFLSCFWIFLIGLIQIASRDLVRETFTTEHFPVIYLSHCQESQASILRIENKDIPVVLKRISFKGLEFLNMETGKFIHELDLDDYLEPNTSWSVKIMSKKLRLIPHQSKYVLRILWKNLLSLITPFIHGPFGWIDLLTSLQKEKTFQQPMVFIEWGTSLFRKNLHLCAHSI